MWTIDKTFEFCYGHRVWSQVLDGRFSDDLKCACRHLHGHEAKVQIFLESTSLNDQGMVTDFRHLEWLKKWINAYVDHKFIFDAADPVVSTLFSEVTTESLFVGSNREVARIAVSSKTGPLFEVEEGLLFVDFVPTSENLAKWMHSIVQEKMKPLGVVVSRVDWWETPKSRSSYLYKAPANSSGVEGHDPGA